MSFYGLLDPSVAACWVTLKAQYIILPCTISLGDCGKVCREMELTRKISSINTFSLNLPWYCCMFICDPILLFKSYTHFTPFGAGASLGTIITLWSILIYTSLFSLIWMVTSTEAVTHDWAHDTQHGHAKGMFPSRLGWFCLAFVGVKWCEVGSYQIVVFLMH